MNMKEAAIEKINEIHNKSRDSESYKMDRNMLLYEIESQETKAEIIEHEVKFKISFFSSKMHVKFKNFFYFHSLK